MVQIVLLGLGPQNLHLLRQTRHVSKTRRPAARAPAHEAFLRFPVEGLRADEARLALRVVGALLDRDRDGLLVFFVGVILFVSTSLFNLLAELVMAALFPVFFLALRSAVARAAAAAFLAQS
jgi:hypothetical protein